ncbi:MAG: TIR domain-containing protein [Anaerolineae bacterium]|nr:TIR domain-containing protein [Anaerolineae bacterium]
MSQIFVSHATADDTMCDRVCAALERASLIPWADHRKGIPVGEYWGEQIEQAVKDCQHGLLLLSYAAKQSRWCRAEWTRLLHHRDQREKGFYVALVESMPVEDVPIELGTIQYVDLAHDFDGGMRELIEALGASVPLDPADSPLVRERRKLTTPPHQPIPRELIAIPMRGREAAYDEALTCLRAAPTTIEGVGGLGKSRLAAEIVASSPDVDEAIWLRLGETTTEDELTGLLRAHYAQPKETDWPALLDLVRAGGQLLIVLDNAESVKQAERRAAFVERIEALHAAGAQILLTSRAAWRELRGGRHVHPAALAQAEAAAAVPDMARFHDARQEKIAERADDIAREGRNHPKLIEWAVGQMSHQQVHVVIGWLADVNNPDVQGALDDMIGRTLREMSAAEGDAPAWALRRLNVTQGGFTWEAARALCVVGDEGEDDPAVRATRRVAPTSTPIRDDAALAAALESLQRWQFVSMDAQGRYTVDPMATEVGGEDESAQRPHYDFYKAMAREHDRKQDYLGLDVESANLEAAFEWAMREGAEAALWLANAVSSFLANRGRYLQRLEWIERALTSLQVGGNEALIANAQNSLGVAYQEHPLGDRRENLRRAVAAFEQALLYRTPEAAPLAYAMTQNNLGTAYQNLAAVEDRAGNLRRAVVAYEQALRFYTPEAAPLDYAMTQNNLGAAFRDLAALEDRAGNLRRAVKAYELALLYRTPEAAPLAYAMTQNNLGNAYRNLAAVEDRAGNLRRAVAAFEQALRFRTPEAAPLAYATTQNNLGTAYSNLAALEDRAGNLRRAVTAYEQALRFRTPEAAPLDYAMTQNNLGNAYVDLAAVEDRAGNLRRAVKAYELALLYRTPEAAPLDYSLTQENVGLVLVDLAEIENREENLDLAIKAYREALRFLTPEQAPYNHAKAQRHLGMALELRGDMPAAVACWREAERYYRIMGYIEDADKMLRGIADAEGGEDEG